MGAKKFGAIMILIAIGLGFAIYYDSKTTNVIPPVIIIIALFSFLIGIIALKHGYRKRRRF